MAKHNLHTDPKWNDLLNAYREGTITPDAMHQLEKAALDDPFLFDAMEGYALYRSSSDSKNIQDLAALTPKEKAKIRKINYFKWSSVAALFLLLISVTFIMRNQVADKVEIASETTMSTTESENPIAGVLQKDESSEELIEKEISTSENDNNTDFGAVKAGDENEEKSDQEIQPPPQTISPPPVVESPAPSGSSVSKQDKDEAQSYENQDQIEVAESIMEEVFSDDLNQSTPVENEAVEGVPLNRKKSKLPADNRFENKEIASSLIGRIVDQEGLPLIGANVNIENTEIGTITNIEGKFSLPIYPSGIQLVSTYTGYEPSFTMIQDDSFYNITLTESQMLDEVVAVDYNIPGTEKEVIPEIGYDGMVEFIRKYKNIPINAFSANYKGSIAVEFMINEDGTLSEFFSKDEGCNACINEAIRLLKLAGKWKTIPEGIKRKAAYTISF